MTGSTFTPSTPKRFSQSSAASANSETGSVGSTAQSVRRKTNVVNFYQDEKLSLEDTAISATCQSLALIERCSFTIRSIPQNTELKFAHDFPVICCGGNDGRFGKSRKLLSDAPLPFQPEYMRAVMSDRTLCIACQEGYVEVHDAETGRLLSCIIESCCNLAMSPDGELLALAIDSGELLVYGLGPKGDFDQPAVWVIQKIDDCELRLVKCMTFSPDSEHLSVCTFDNIIRTYHVDIVSNSSTLISTYDSKLHPKYEGITGLSLYRPFLLARLIISYTNSSVIVSAYAQKTYPFKLKYVTSRQNPWPKPRTLAKDDNGKDCEDYGDTNCGVACSILYNASLMISHTGLVRIADFGKDRSRSVDNMMNERMNGSQPWRDCRLALLEGIGLALDRRGKLLVIKFNAT